MKVADTLSYPEIREEFFDDILYSVLESFKENEPQFICGFNRWCVVTTTGMQ